MFCLDDNVIAQFAEGLLDGQQLTALEAHIDRCAECRRVVAALAIGERPSASGRFVALRQLEGDDGGVEVSFAWHREQHAPVLLVQLSASAAPDTLELERGLQGALRLRHDNVLSLLEVGVHQGRSTLVYQSGGTVTLAQRLSRGARGARGAREALRVGLPIAQALASAHAEALAHLRLSPRAVWVDLEGVVRVAGFGAATVLGAASLDDAATPLARYLAPEIWRDAAAGASADIWALGVMLYELCTGEHPFAAPDDSLLELGARIVAPSALELDGDIDAPAGLVALVGRCLAKQPDERIDAAELLHALRELAPEPLAPHVIGALERVEQHGRVLLLGRERAALASALGGLCDELDSSPAFEVHRVASLDELAQVVADADASRSARHVCAVEPDVLRDDLLAAVAALAGARPAALCFVVALDRAAYARWAAPLERWCIVEPSAARG